LGLYPPFLEGTGLHVYQQDRRETFAASFSSAKAHLSEAGVIRLTKAGPYRIICVCIRFVVRNMEFPDNIGGAGKRVIKPWYWPRRGKTGHIRGNSSGPAGGFGNRRSEAKLSMGYDLACEALRRKIVGEGLFRLKSVLPLDRFALGPLALWG